MGHFLDLSIISQWGKTEFRTNRLELAESTYTYFIISEMNNNKK